MKHALAFTVNKDLIPKSLYSTKKSISSYLIRRGQDSNLQSSGHEPDESTNSSTPLLPLLFLVGVISNE